jgi:release factor glutamine methyltransferase
MRPTLGPSLTVGSVGTPGLATLLADATARLHAAGLRHARREALQLYAAVAGLTVGAVWMALERPVPAGLASPFQRAVAGRIAGEPFAYAAGRVAFRTLDLRVDRRALIPRPETEGLVDLVLAHTARGGVAADVGTGCGCLALSLAVEGRCTRVVATERSPEAAVLARENVSRLAPPVPVDVRVGDLLEPLAGARYVVIVSNPPYLTDAEYAALDPAVRDYEPRGALASGPDGLAATRALLAGAAALLSEGGLLALEIDERRAPDVRCLAAAWGWRVTIHDDLFGRARYALARRACGGEGAA